MRHTSIWILEFLKLLTRGGFIPTPCPICQCPVRLHVNKAGRRHLFAHARGLFEGSRFSIHYVAKAKCPGSGAQIKFDPRPDKHQRFKLPDSLFEE